MKAVTQMYVCDSCNTDIFKLRIKRLMKRWKHSGGNVINAGQVNLVSTYCL